MIAKNGFKIRQVAGMNILVPENEEMDFSEVLTMNDSAAFIWAAIQEERSFEEVLLMMKSEFDAPEDVLRADLVEFIDVLKQKGLIAD